MPDAGPSFSLATGRENASRDGGTRLGQGRGRFFGQVRPGPAGNTPGITTKPGMRFTRSVHRRMAG